MLTGAKDGSGILKKRKAAMETPHLSPPQPLRF